MSEKQTGKQRIQPDPAEATHCPPKEASTGPDLYESEAEGIRKLSREEMQQELEAMSAKYGWTQIVDMLEDRLREYSMPTEAQARDTMPTTKEASSASPQDVEQAQLQHPGTSSPTAIESSKISSILERKTHASVSKVLGHPARPGRKKAAMTFMTFRPWKLSRKTSRKSLLPTWKHDLVVKPRDCKGFWIDLLCSVPAIAYSITAWIPVCAKLEHKVQLGLQIANAVLFVVLSGMGLLQGRFGEENRWYMRHYFLWTVVSHVVTFFFGFYSTIAADGTPSTQVLDVSSVVQAVQTLPFWSVELFDIERLKVEKEEEKEK